MKNFATIAPLLFFSCELTAETSYKLIDALKQNMVSVQMSGAKPDTSSLYESSHTGACMAMEIKNNNSAAMVLSLEYGYLLVPTDSQTQTMMVTKTLAIKLEPKQRKNYRLYAMCTEAHDAGPSYTKDFYLGKRTTGNLLALSELINRKNYQNSTAQNAVWCLTNNYSISSITSNDTLMMYELRRFVAKAKGLNASSVYANDYTSAYSPEPTYITRTVYSGTFTYSIASNSKILIALFDTANHMKRVYVNNELQREGQYAYTYQITSEETNNQKHYLRMFKNGKLEDEIAIVPR